MVKRAIEYPGDFPLSMGVLHNEKYHLELSGLIGINLSTGALAEGIENQTRQAIENIKNTLDKVGWDLSNVIKVRIYLSSMENYKKMNETYEEYFTENYPSRVAFAVKELPAGALIELECTASGDKVSS